MRKAFQTKILSVNEVYQEKRYQYDCCKDKEHHLQLCKEKDNKIDEEFVVNYTDLGNR